MKRSALASIACAVLILCSNSFGQTSAFTYQGKLNENGGVANGQYDLTFRLFDTDTSMTPVAPDVIVENIQVTDGIFTVELSFSTTPFRDLSGNWLEISIRPGASTGAFSTLSPRQKITSSPYAMQSAFSTSTTNVTGVVGIANGGTGSTTKNFVDLTTNQTVGGRKTFTDPIAGNGSELTNINGANITNNTINASALAADSFPDIRNRTLLGSLRWDLLKQRITVGTFPNQIAFDGSHIWVTNAGPMNVMKIRVSDGAIVGTYPVTGGSVGIAFDGSNMWVTNGGSGITKLRASDGANLGTFMTGGSFPYYAAFDGENMWVSNSGFNNVTKLRASDGANLGSFVVGNGARGVVFDGENIWVVSSLKDQVTKLRASDGANLGSFPTGSFPSGPIAFDGANIWVPFSTGITKIRASDGANLGTFATGSGPYFAAFDGSNIWVTNYGGNSVTKIRASDGVILGTYIVGASPQGIAFDGSSMWVTNFNAGTVTKVPVFP